MSVSKVLSELNVSKSGYYDWLQRKPSNQSKRKEFVCTKIEEIHKESYQIYGAPKISNVLKNKGIYVSQKTVSNYMKQLDIRAHYRKKYTITTISKGFHTKLKNVLNRDFIPSQPNQAWCTDITYIWTEQVFVYLTSIMDLYSRRIIVWDISDSLNIGQ